MRPSFSVLCAMMLVLGCGASVGCSLYDAELLSQGIAGDESAGDGGTEGDGDGDGDIASGGSGGGPASGGAGTGGNGMGGDLGAGGGTGSSPGAGGMTSFPTGVESTLDDFDDGNATIKLEAERFGYWNAYTDGTADDTAMTPGPNQPFVTTERDDEPENDALRVTAVGFTSWGIGMFCSFDDPGGGTLEPYDLLGRGYDGIRFWAKKETTADASSLVIKIADAASTLDTEGGNCPEATCALDHAQIEVQLTTDWAEYTVPFTDFARTATPDPIDFSQAFQFHITQKSESIDFWIDDIRFVDFDG